MPTRCAGAAPGLAIHGIMTKSSSRSTANHGNRHYQCWAVEKEGHVLDILVQRHCDKAAVNTFFRKLLKGCQDVPRVIIIDQLKCYGAAKRAILPSVEHRPHRL
jgi:putative transposase